ncbi:MAG: yajC [Ilumatobacteraceae bacterium]|nr:yajC [Ilumatobacteraceae bacterium]MCU1390898.1 yajC [Ilumatobacteraceae bacterium]
MMISTAHLIGSLLAADSSGGSALSLLFLPLMLVGAYFLLIRPQRRRQKETAVLQGALEEGDEVITTSGIYGFITGFDGDIIWLEVDDNIQIRVSRRAVQGKVDTSAMHDASKSASTTIDDIVEDNANDK